MTFFYNCNKKLYTRIKKRENADFLKATVKKVAFSEKEYNITSIFKKLTL